MARARVQLDAAVRMAAPAGKLVALSETGCEGLAVTDWYDSVLTPLMEGYPLAYVCVWRIIVEISHAVGRIYPQHVVDSLGIEHSPGAAPQLLILLRSAPAC